MDYKAYLTIALVLVVLISASRRRVVTELQSIALLTSGNTQIGTWIYSLIFFPGTVLHELSHWLVAELLQVRTGKVELVPDLQHDISKESTLGSVRTESTGPLRSFVIGVAPFVVGSMLLLVLANLLNTLWDSAPYWQVGLVLYCLVVVGNSMMISRADRASWPIIIILMTLLVLTLWQLNLRLPLDFNKILGPSLMSLVYALLLPLIINLGLISLFYGIRRIIERVTKKRVVIGRHK